MHLYVEHAGPLYMHEAGLAALGWHKGAPSKMAEEVDGAAATEAQCEHCGAHGLSYHPWQKGKRYKALADCPACGHVEEF